MLAHEFRIRCNPITDIYANTMWFLIVWCSGWTINKWRFTSRKSSIFKTSNRWTNSCMEWRNTSNGFTVLMKWGYGIFYNYIEVKLKISFPMLNTKKKCHRHNIFLIDDHFCYTNYDYFFLYIFIPLFDNKSKINYAKNLSFIQ